MHVYDYMLIEFNKEIVKDWYYSNDPDLDYDDTINRLLIASRTLLTAKNMQKNAMEHHSFERALSAFNELNPEIPLIKYTDVPIITNAHVKQFLRLLYIKS